MRLIDFFDRGLMLNPNGPCLIESERVISYAEAADISHRVARAASASGMESGTKAAVYSPNQARVMECILGILRAGIIWLPINARNALEENIYVLNMLECDWLFYHSAFEAQVAEIKARTPSLKKLICLDRESAMAASFENWISGQSGAAPSIQTDAEAAATILCSGGTTGRPKGVVMTHRSWELMICNYATSMPFAEVPRQLVAAPLSHGAGAMCFPVFAGGGANVIMTAPDPLSIMEHIEKFRITRLYLPPTLIYMMLAHPRVRDFDYSSLKYFLSAAAPISIEKLKEAIAVFGPVMCQSFGQAESHIFVTYLSPEEHSKAICQGKERRLWSCGRPTLTNQIEIMDDDGRLLRPGERGEIVIRSNMLMKEYYLNPEATREAGAHGWHHTGDIGEKDEDGYIYIVDRKKDMIISGGFNVYPSEVEQVIMEMSGVRDCAVVGVPDEKWGEAVKAVAELRSGAQLSGEDVIEYCRARLGGVKTPKSVEFWDALPRSPVGKVLKKEIRRKFWEGQSRQVA